MGGAQANLTGIRDLGAISAPALAPGFQAMGEALGQAGPLLLQMARVIMPALSQVMERLAPVIPALFQAFMPFAGVLAQIAAPIASIVANMAPLAPVIMGTVIAVKVLGAALIAGKAAMMVFSVAQGVAAAATGVGTAALAGNTIALGAHKAATVASTIASRALGVAMTLGWNGEDIYRGRRRCRRRDLERSSRRPKLGSGCGRRSGRPSSTRRRWPGSGSRTRSARLGSSSGHGWWSGGTAGRALSTFVGAVKTVWTAIQPAVTWLAKLWLTVQKFNFTVAIAALKGLGAVIGWLWTNVVVPAFKGIALAVETWWAGVQVVWNLAKPAIQAIGDVIMWLWHNVAVPAFEAIKTAVTTWWDGVQHVWGLFQTGVDTVGKAITTLKDGFTTGFNAIKGVVETVWNFISGVLEKIKSGIGGVVDKLNSIPGLNVLIPGGNADGRSPGFARGTVSKRGVVSGPGSGTSDSILARISDGEGIVKASAMKAGGGVLVSALNAGWTPTAEQMHQLFRIRRRRRRAGDPVASLHVEEGIPRSRVDQRRQRPARRSRRARDRQRGRHYDPELRVRRGHRDREQDPGVLAEERGPAQRQRHHLARAVLRLRRRPGHREAIRRPRRRHREPLRPPARHPGRRARRRRDADRGARHEFDHRPGQFVVVELVDVAGRFDVRHPVRTRRTGRSLRRRIR